MLPERYFKPPTVKTLLVDDEQIALFTLSSVLKQSGFHVATAIDVSGALKLISLGTYDVPASDYYMPGPRDVFTGGAREMRHSNEGRFVRESADLPLATNPC